MYCVRCGTPLQAGAPVCATCGAATGMLPATATVDAEARFRRHLKLLGAFWIAYSLLGVLLGLAIVLVGGFILPEIGMDPTAARFVPQLLFFIGGLVLAKTALGVAAGAALMSARPWARIVLLIYSFLALLSFPFGTALGVYSLVVLLPEEGERLYARLAREAEAQP